VTQRGLTGSFDAPWPKLSWTSLRTQDADKHRDPIRTNQTTTTPLRHMHKWIKYYRVPVPSKSYTSEIYISYRARAQYFKSASGELQSHIGSPKFTWPENVLHPLLSNWQFLQGSWTFPLKLALRQDRKSKINSTLHVVTTHINLIFDLKR